MGVVTCPFVLPSFFVEDDYLKTFSAHIDAYKHMGACDNQDCLVEEKWCASVTIRRKNHRKSHRKKGSQSHRKAERVMESIAERKLWCRRSTL